MNAKWYVPVLIGLVVVLLIWGILDREKNTRR
jgi:hypothetical protein